MSRAGLVAWVVLVDQSLPFLQVQELVLCEVVILLVLVDDAGRIGDAGRIVDV